MANRRKLRRLVEEIIDVAEAPDLGAGLTTYSSVTNDELCRLFRTHEHPLVEELVSRLDVTITYEGEVDELDKKIDDLNCEIGRVIDWGEELEKVITKFVDQEQEASDDDRPTIEDLIEAHGNVERPAAAER